MSNKLNQIIYVMTSYRLKEASKNKLVFSLTPRNSRLRKLAPVLDSTKKLDLVSINHHALTC